MWSQILTPLQQNKIRKSALFFQISPFKKGQENLTFAESFLQKQHLNHWKIKICQKFFYPFDISYIINTKQIFCNKDQGVMLDLSLIGLLLQKKKVDCSFSTLLPNFCKNSGLNFSDFRILLLVENSELRKSLTSCISFFFKKSPF